MSGACSTNRRYKNYYKTAGLKLNVRPLARPKCRWLKPFTEVKCKCFSEDTVQRRAVVKKVTNICVT